MNKRLFEWIKNEIKRERAVMVIKRPDCSVCNDNEAFYQTSDGKYICMECIIDLGITPEVGFGKGKFIFEESCLYKEN